MLCKSLPCTGGKLIERKLSNDINYFFLWRLRDMKKTLLVSAILSLALVLGLGAPALAAPVSWTDWTTASSGQVNGVLTFGTTDVAVTFNGGYLSAQLNGGTNYWIPATPYISATVPNAPPDPDIIKLDIGGTATINFSQPVENPLLALVSWNGNTVDFGVPIQILSSGTGYWGTGTFILNSTGTGFVGSGEAHGVVELPGVYSSITFTHTSENWHGLTVGATAAAVPLPPSAWLVGSGLLALVGFRKKFLA